MTLKKEETLIDWSEEKILAFRKALLDWYDREKRDIPWRQHADNPYYIWVSEIMLQQTQVATVVPYFERFINKLPTIQSLAEADEEILMHLWQGLGYYSRVRNMQTAAQQIMDEYQGEMPQTYEELLNLKGIGPYTAAAIASIAYGIPEPALDGNLIRIVTRLFNLHHDITKAKSKRLFKDIYKILIDPERPGDFNQALMDMGATIMTASNPYPDPHPLKAFDASYEAGTAHLLPFDISSSIIIIAALMPLYPGTAFTNGIRDTLKGDYVSGVARIADAFVIALSIALGVAIGLSLYGGVSAWMQ